MPSFARAVLLGTTALVASVPLLAGAAHGDVLFTGTNGVSGSCATGATACTLTGYTVGFLGTGSLTVNNATILTVSEFATIGESNAGNGETGAGNGSLLLTGRGTELRTGGNGTSAFHIGRNGATGTAQVTNNALWTISAGVSGDDAGEATLSVGRNAGANGRLTIDAGGRVLVQDTGTNTGDDGVQIGGTGQNTNGVGTIVVSGSGSRLSVQSTAASAYLNVGRNGTAANGTLSVLNGGTVDLTSGALDAVVNVGRGGALGTLEVAGTGSALTLSAQRVSSLHVGRDNTGTATVTSGGSVTLSSANGAAVVLGQEVAGNGTMTVNGSGSRLALSGTGTNDQSIILQVGRFGTGTFRVEQGGTVTVDAGQTVAGVQIARESGSTGSLVVTGAGSSLTVSGSGAASDNGPFFQVGRAGSGRLDVLDGGTLTFNTGTPLTAGLTIGGTGSVSGGSGAMLVSGSGSTVTVSGGSASVAVGTNGTGSLAITDSGRLNTLDLTVGYAAGSVGTMVMTSGGSVRLSGTDQRDSGGAQALIGQAGTGSLTMTGGSTVTIDTSGGANGGLFVGAEAGGRGTVLLSGTGTVLDAGSELGIGYTAGSTAEGGTGSVTVNDGATLRATTVRLGSSGGSSALSKMLSFNSTGRIESANVLVNPGGVLSGTGTITGHVTLNGGTLTTGGSVGTMTIGNGLTVNSGTIEVKVNGRTAGSYDVYAVTGTAELNGGTMLVVFADSFTPAEGERFNVIQATDGITGTGVTSVQTNLDGVTASVVPAEQTGGIDVVIVGGTASAAQEAEATISTTAEQQTRSVVRTVVAAVSGRVREAMAARRGRATAGIESESGLAAGNGGSTGLAAWADGGASRLINSQTGGKFDGWGRTLLVGADYTVGSLVLGAAVGLERSTLSIQQNDGDRKAHGGSLVAYAGYLIDDTFSADVQVAAGRLSNRLREMRGGVVDTGNFDSNRLIVAANLTAVHTVSDWTMTGIVGTSFSRERFDSYSTDAGLRVDPGSVYLGQLRVGGELSYAVSPTINPYVAASYEVDVRSSENGDRNGAVLGAGLRAALADNFTVGVFGSAQVLRRDDENYAIAVNGRYSF
ncbi:hypothetical protein HL658_32715 [Azospirillum sp. RWY-5-1]|uniref:Autotransporter domain-containing protein n=1 Tax=Azospirillum oleiclasticum TaxID=2735135 RepID=A0ABX2TML4_9PROT|nr:autotransporter outer membrane beta-barrel domain-containing protein [Azospirillum oleiclasticum]NYZ17331.1 hypothetical protein [Azospirillum oleiclasticum]NYZ24727.1 hypothetical protein [Azospirillum oleiclasticum]